MIQLPAAILDAERFEQNGGGTFLSRLRIASSRTTDVSRYELKYEGYEGEQSLPLMRPVSETSSLGGS